MKNIIILLTSVLWIYNFKASSVRHPKKNSFIRVKNKQQDAINNNVSGIANQSNNNKIATLKGFKSIELLNPDFLNQSTTKNSVNNTNKMLTNPPTFENKSYSNQQNGNQIVNNNSIEKNINTIPYNHHITNNTPITLANQMNTIYNQNKQNQNPQGSAYANYQSNMNNYSVGLNQQAVQPQSINQQTQSNQQSLLSLNNNQNQTALPMYYENNQNLQYNNFEKNNNIQNVNSQYIVSQ